MAILLLVQGVSSLQSLSAETCPPNIPAKVNIIDTYIYISVLEKESDLSNANEKVKSFHPISLLSEILPRYDIDPKVDYSYVMAVGSSV